MSLPLLKMLVFSKVVVESMLSQIVYREFPLVHNLANTNIVVRLLIFANLLGECDFKVYFSDYS